MRVAQRRIQVVGITSAPDGLWMDQIARSQTLADVGFLSGCRYLLHDRDTKFTEAFDAIQEPKSSQGAADSEFHRRIGVAFPQVRV